MLSSQQSIPLVDIYSGFSAVVLITLFCLFGKGLNWKLSIAVKRTMVVVHITVNMHLVGPIVPVTMDTSLIQMEKRA